jgi:signal transduction histidine kinase
MGLHNTKLSYLESDLRKLEVDNRELKKQVNSLININIIQEKELNKKQYSVSFNKNLNNRENLTEVSKDKIKHYVDNLLENSDTNISYLPDFVEKKIYTNILGVALKVLDDMLQTTTMKFLGHEIAFDLREDLDNEVNVHEGQVDEKKELL